ncbi:hypothetical protein DFH05DRAFT_1365583, partial [Lentinula detonsa]
IYTAAKYATSPDIDQTSTTVIPTLQIAGRDGTINRLAKTNEEKAALLATTFFPPAPRNYSLDRNPSGDQLPSPPPITMQQVIEIFQKLKPYKAPGPDAIPNVVLKQCTSPYVTKIYNAIGDLKAYPRIWLESDTVVIRKPARKSYSIPKAYRPIALINTLAKGYTAIVAQEISYLAEKHELLPDTQFG